MLRAMLLSFSAVGLVLDVGMLIGPRMDTLFNRTQVLTGTHNPYPILPALNLGHHSPAFSYHALGFLADAYLDRAPGFASATRSGRGFMGNDWLANPRLAALLHKQYCKWDLPLEQIDDLVTNDFELASSKLFCEGLARAPALVGYAVRLAVGAASELTIERYVNTAWRLMYAMNTSMDKHLPWLAVPSHGIWITSAAEAAILRIPCIV